MKLKRPVQRLDPLEIQCAVPVRQASEDCSSQNPDPVTPLPSSITALSRG